MPLIPNTSIIVSMEKDSNPLLKSGKEDITGAENSIYLYNKKE